jgi:hypothetical protein
MIRESRLSANGKLGIIRFVKRKIVSKRCLSKGIKYCLALTVVLICRSSSL